MRDTLATPASAQDGTYPRPQLMRASWADLSGPWEFEFDDADRGLADGWPTRTEPFSRTILVPFPPESPASGIADPGYHRVLWYRRTVTAADLAAAGHRPGRTLLVHFGAVDYRADVWIDGHHVAHHEGGHTPFVAVVPPTAAAAGFEIVVRAEDDPHDLAQPRGKQDWQERPHVVWYERTSGIWQPVWLESVPTQHIASLTWRSDLPAAHATLSVELACQAEPGTRLAVTLRTDRTLASLEVELTDRRANVVIPLPALRNGQDRDGLLWSPDRPTLIDADVRLTSPSGESDRIASYLGIRSIAAADGAFVLNGRPAPIRGVLSQGYWPESHLAAPSAEHLRAEAQLIRDLGFSTVRVHQKIEDPRFLYWADRLGLLVWAEMPSTYEFSPTAATRLVTEWCDVVRRDSSHPSVVVWVPVNESWGVQDLAVSAPQRELVRTLVHLTRTLDDTRLVISNDGWEHTASDLFTVHDYENDAASLHRSYASPSAASASLEGIAPHGRRSLVGTPEECAWTVAAPIVLSEFGGVSVVPDEQGSWGYELVDSRDHLAEHLAGLFTAVRESAGLAGWCYTQLTDTAQETNGLTDEHRVPKVPIERIRAMVTGRGDARATSPTLA
jgi:beta-galactosidase/beta-glucuronidase